MYLNNDDQPPGKQVVYSTKMSFVIHDIDMCNICITIESYQIDTQMNKRSYIQ